MGKTDHKCPKCEKGNIEYTLKGKYICRDCDLKCEWDPIIGALLPDYQAYGMTKEEIEIEKGKKEIEKLDKEYSKLKQKKEEKELKEAEALKRFKERQELNQKDDIPETLLYVLSFFIPILGIIIGVIFLQHTGEEGARHRKVGKNCILCALIIPVIAIVLVLTFWFLIFIALIFS